MYWKMLLGFLKLIKWRFIKKREIEKKRHHKKKVHQLQLDQADNDYIVENLIKEIGFYLGLQRDALLNSNYLS